MLCLKSRNNGETRSAKANKRKTLLFIDFNIFIRHRSLQFVYIYIYIYIYKYNSLNAGHTSEDIHSFNATDLFRMAKDGHTHQAI